MQIFDLMDSLKAKYNQHQLTPVLETMLRLTPVRADLAWEVLRRAMLQRYAVRAVLLVCVFCSFVCCVAYYGGVIVMPAHSLLL